ncbi:hypothetical protein CSKR_114010 [Clonorchis sinensis]|uniref:Uncharacterized protein n=1 Tax=Clonorchis sinensis TaxID=79923 RepID=A0A3R7FIH1_CLOSI|nr:hypothetical protein CSKR_114010 [Clonorchis sinensis]
MVKVRFTYDSSNCPVKPARSLFCRSRNLIGVKRVGTPHGHHFGYGTFWTAIHILQHARKSENTKNLLCSYISRIFLNGQAYRGEQTNLTVRAHAHLHLTPDGLLEQVMFGTSGDISSKLLEWAWWRRATCKIPSTLQTVSQLPSDLLAPYPALENEGRSDCVRARGRNPQMCTKTIGTCGQHTAKAVGAEMTQRLERDFTDRKDRGSNPDSAPQLLSRLGPSDSISALMLPSGGMAAR